MRGAGNSRIDWRVNFATANRDEPDLRETLYQAPFIAGTLQPNLTTPPVLADESQSGFRMFNTLDDQTIDGAFNWSTFASAGSRPTQYKFGVNYVDRSRDFQSRRFRFIPIILTKDGLPTVSQTLTPEELYTTNNIGTAFRFNEETRPVDAYNGEQTTASVYGMVDIALSARTRINGGARVEHADQTVTTFDPFGLFVRTIEANLKNTDVFPAINVVQGVASNQNLRLSYSTTVNRPEFRELAAVRVHRRGRQPRHPRQSQSAAGAHPECRCALGNVPGRPQHFRDQRVLQALRQADRARRHRRRAADCHVPERRLGTQLRR